MYVPNSWSLNPGFRNKPKLSTKKFGKDDQPVFDKNWGYDGPDRITAIVWISASCNVKEALMDLQMELEGKNLQIRWTPT